MRSCPKCGLLNPDRAEFCIKCRFNFGPAPEPEPVQAPHPAPSGPVPDDGSPLFDAPPDLIPPDGFSAKPELKPPAPDIDDTFSGRGLDVGGYGMDGATSGSPPRPAPGDAFAIMTGGDAMSTDLGSGRRDRKSKKEPRVSKRLPRPGKQVKGLPPAQGGLPPPREMAPPMPGPQAPAFTAAPPPAAPPGRPPGEAPGPAPYRGERRPLPPGKKPGGAKQRRAPTARAGAKPARERRPLPKPDFSFLSNAGKLLNARNALTLVAALPVLLALIYLATGGSYFARGEQDIVGKASAKMASLSGFRMNIDVRVASEKMGDVTENVQVAVAGNSAFNAVYTVAAPEPQKVVPVLQVIRSGKTYAQMPDGTWAAGAKAAKGVDFLPSSFMGDASGIAYVDRQGVDGVPCDHVTFAGGEAFTRGLFPGAEIPQSSTLTVELWVDAAERTVRHLRVSGSGLRQGELGGFSFQADASFAEFGSTREIGPPV